MGLITEAPFLFMDLPGGDVRLYEKPVAIIETSAAGQVRDALRRAREATRNGYYVAGFLSYEAGAALQPRLISSRQASLPLVWFGVFTAPRLCSAPEFAAMFPKEAYEAIGDVRYGCSETEYRAMFDRVRDLILGGDIYQANLTIRASLPFKGSPLSIFAAIRQRARAPNAAFVYTGSDWILSFSPESFFDLRGRQVTARPMKGTAPRGVDPDADQKAVESLRSDPKERAENLMIVDLMRNDLARLALPGSVRVPILFDVETYPTVHQLTSTVVAELRADADAIDVLESAFPAGSITGAPKVRAMEVIAELEREPRGIYCGSIGWIDPDGDASFNVAIRTLHLENNCEEGTLGLGSGIVADSVANLEWLECQTKALFLSEREVGQKA